MSPVHPINPQFGDTGLLQMKAQVILRGYTPQLVFNLIYDLKKNLTWGSTWKTLEAIEQINALNEAIYLVINTPFGVSYRDFVQFRGYHISDDKRLFVMCLKNGIHPNKPEQYGMVRGETLGIGGYIFRRIDDGTDGVPVTRVTNVAAVDPKGYIPKSIVNWLCARNPKSWDSALRAACKQHENDDDFEY
jgi:hypothetical protein